MKIIKKSITSEYVKLVNFFVPVPQINPENLGFTPYHSFARYSGIIILEKV